MTATVISHVRTALAVRDSLQHGIYEKEMPLTDILKAESLFYSLWKLDLNDEFGDDP